MQLVVIALLAAALALVSSTRVAATRPADLPFIVVWSIENSHAATVVCINGEPDFTLARDGKVYVACVPTSALSIH